jgi:hypothetical protein
MLNVGAWRYCAISGAEVITAAADANAKRRMDMTMGSG